MNKKTGELKTRIIIKDKYKELLDKDIYESLLLDIINDSKIVLPGNFKRIVDQSNNQSDYESSAGEYYDAKLLFYKDQCRYLSKGTDGLNEFIGYIQEETNDIYDVINTGNVEKLKDCIFYKEMKDRIESANEEENIILFVPFAFTLDFESSFSSYMAPDIFSYIFTNILNENNILKNNRIYIIYPNYENKIVIRNLNNNQLEFLDNNYLKNYILFEVEKVGDE